MYTPDSVSLTSLARQLKCCIIIIYCRYL